MFRLQKLSSLVPALVALPLVGCVQRTLSIDTNAPGALVVLNDREVGRTPFTVPFTWYGAYDVVVRADGFRTIKTSAEVTAPWWQWVPFDLLTDFLPVADRETLHFDLKPETPTRPGHRAGPGGGPAGAVGIQRPDRPAERAGHQTRDPAGDGTGGLKTSSDGADIGRSFRRRDRGVATVGHFATRVAAPRRPDPCDPPRRAPIAAIIRHRRISMFGTGIEMSFPSSNVLVSSQ